MKLDNIANGRRAEENIKYRSNSVLTLDLLSVLYFLFCMLKLR